MAHQHHLHGRTRSGRSLLVAAMLNVFITAAEVVGGLLSGSLALISDALHNFSDAAGLVVAWASNRVAGRPADPKRTFGYRRAEIVGALVNAVFLLSVAVFLAESAVRRLFQPEPVSTGLMIPVAVFCLAGNVASAFLLAFGTDRTLNVKAALAHIISDSFSSVAVIIAALVIRWTGWLWIDPILALLIAVYASVQAVILLKDTVHILMQGAPKGLDQATLMRDLARVKGVTGIHHVHLWSLDEHETFFEAHVAVGKKDLGKIESIKGAVKLLLRQRYGISHSTLEFESSKRPGCEECLPDHPELGKVAVTGKADASRRS